MCLLCQQSWDNANKHRSWCIGLGMTACVCWMILNLWIPLINWTIDATGLLAATASLPYNETFMLPGMLRFCSRNSGASYQALLHVCGCYSMVILLHRYTQVHSRRMEGSICSTGLGCTEDYNFAALVWAGQSSNLAWLWVWASLVAVNQMCKLLYWLVYLLCFNKEKNDINNYRE